MARLLNEDKQFNRESLKDIYNYAYSPSKGIITGMGKEMLAYFRPGFHPNDLDTVSLLATWKRQIRFLKAVWLLGQFRLPIFLLDFMQTSYNAVSVI